MRAVAEGREVMRVGYRVRGRRMSEALQMMTSTASLRLYMISTRATLVTSKTLFTS